MNVLDYQFPKVTNLDLAFSTLNSPPALLEEAKKRGFYGDKHSPANKLFSDWFYRGIDKLPEFKKGIDEDKARKVLNWTRCFMGSFKPKHEEKEAICTLIFSEIFELI